LCGEECTRIGGIRICSSARGGLAKSVEGDGEAAALQIECNFNSHRDGVARDETANGSAAPRGALYEPAQRCGATHAQEYGAAEGEKRIHV
jgi:hypothetical protein